MKIKMVCGTYGMCDTSHIILKSSKDPAFEVDDEEARRLIDMGRARAVDEKPPSEPEEELENDTSALPHYDKTMKFSRLLEVARAYGVDTLGMHTKDEIIEAIETSLESDEEPPKVDVAPPVG